jgi:hypothetical protein
MPVALDEIDNLETIMRRLLTLAWLCMPLLCQANPASPQQTEQQRECGMEAGAKTIEARPGSMHDCTGGKSHQEPVSGSQEVQHAKKKACSTEAMQKPKGPEREQYIAQCMKKKK